MLLSIRYYSLLIVVTIFIVNLMIKMSFFEMFQHKEPPSFIKYLGKMLPFCILPMLVIYCIKDTEFLNYKSSLPVFLGIAVTSTAHLIKKNTILSLILGTATYMILIRVL